MKLTNNMLCAVALVATSEAMTMSGNAGIPDEAMLQILNNGTGRNFATMHLFPDDIPKPLADVRSGGKADLAGSPKADAEVV